MFCTCTFSVVTDYVKWQLLIHAYSLYTAPLPQESESWKILRNVKFPKTSKLSDDTKLTCVELIENNMPLAVARPFVKEFITDSMIAEVQLSYGFCINNL